MHGPADITRFPRTTEATLFARARAGDAAARARLTERYLPLARSLARKFAGRHEPLEDLVQVASMGLLRAIDRFDPDRGIAFSSFAVPTILGELRRHLRDRGWFVRPPRALQERWLAVVATRARLDPELGREATAEEIAVELECSVEAVVEALEAGRAGIADSLDAPSGDGDDARGSRFGRADGGFDDVEARLGLELAARALTPRQRAVLYLHLDADLTQDEIGALVGISQMQVSRDLRMARRVLASWAAGA